MNWKRYRKLLGPLLAGLGSTFTVAASCIDESRLPTPQEWAVISGAWGSLWLVWRLPNDA